MVGPISSREAIRCTLCCTQSKLMLICKSIIFTLLTLTDIFLKTESIDKIYIQVFISESDYVTDYISPVWLHIVVNMSFLSNAMADINTWMKPDYSPEIFSFFSKCKTNSYQGLATFFSDTICVIEYKLFAIADMK